MSDFSNILEVLNGALEGPASDYVLSRPVLGTLIREGTALGMTGREILAAYRDAGGTIANQTFWQLRGQIASSTNLWQDQVALSLTPDDFIQDVKGGRAGTYRLDFRVYVNRAGASGLPEATTTQFSMLQKELDTDAALDRMGAIASEMTDPESESGAWVGFELIGLSRYTG